MGLGLHAPYHDIGVTSSLRAWTHSSAAIRVAGRRGLGKLCHIECHSLWVQQLLKREGLKKPAELFTKLFESRPKCGQLVGLFYCRVVDGCAEFAPSLRRASATGNTSHNSDALPHLRLREDLAVLFLEAVAEPARGRERRDAGRGTRRSSASDRRAPRCPSPTLSPSCCSRSCWAPASVSSARSD